MHARIDQLLSLRDGEPVASEVCAHVQQCTHCSAETARLAQTREGLRSLPSFEPPQQLWAEIADRAVSRSGRRIPLAFAASVVAFVACGVALIALRDTPAEREIVSVSRSESQPVLGSDEQVVELMAQSRQLEQILDGLPQRPSVQRASLSTTVDSIEGRIQWLDWQLAYSSDTELDERQARRLWSERVQLMDSLVKVRYAESAPMAF